MDLGLLKVKVTFPIVCWKTQNGDLWNAFNDGKNYFGDEAFCKEINDVCCLQPQHNIQIVGIDVPVKLSKGRERKGTIMIIGESPVRDTRKIHKNGIYIGTPFAVAYKFDIPIQCNIYKYIFCKLLDAGYDVYLTDAVKVWDTGLKKKEYANHIDYTILKTEIKNMKPLLIVAWGETAKTACYNIFKNEDFFFHQMHPVNLNWDRWKVKMLKEAIVNNVEIGKNYVNDPREDKVKAPIFLAEFISQEIIYRVSRV